MTEPQTLAERRDFLKRCTRCSQCKFVVAPRSQRHASACPSIDYGQFHAHSGGGQLIMAYGLLEGQTHYTEEMLCAVSSCTMCGNCDTSCKVNFAETIEPLDSLYALRAKVVSAGHSPAAHRTILENLRRHGNAQGRPRPERARWAEGLLPSPQAEGDVMLHIGSTLAYDAARHQALRAVVEALGGAGVVMTRFGHDEGSSGSTAFDLGYTAEARAFAQSMIEAVSKSRVRTLVTFSAQAFAAFRAIYPRFGLSFGATRVLHITEYLHELIQAGRLTLEPLPPAAPVAYHDSCRLGRLSEPWKPRDLGLDNHMSGILTSRAPAALRFGNGGCYEAPRALLRKMGLQLVELERHHASSYCCGACGGVKETVPEAAALAASNRLAELDDAGTATLVTACSGCTQHLARHVRDGVRVIDLLELLAQALKAASVPASLGRLS